jgi:hypothetical protein
MKKSILITTTLLMAQFSMAKIVIENAGDGHCKLKVVRGATTSSLELNHSGAKATIYLRNDVFEKIISGEKFYTDSLLSKAKSYNDTAGRIRGYENIGIGAFPANTETSESLGLEQYFDDPQLLALTHSLVFNPNTKNWLALDSTIYFSAVTEAQTMPAKVTFGFPFYHGEQKIQKEIYRRAHSIQIGHNRCLLQSK